jgi:signal transduction histidine kinase
VAQAQETAVLQERQRLAREIHDTLAQGFTSIVMHLEAAEQGIPTALQTTQHHLTQARQTARESLGQARRVVDDLRPELLESRPLDEALGRVAHNWSMQSGIPAALQVTGAAQKLHPQVEVTLLRATQEALNNIRKHARAERVAVTLSYLDDMVILDVQDDGRGFVAAAGAEETAVSSGFGLVAMRERVEQLGGELVIESEPDEGATLMVSIPIGAMPDAG